MGKLTEIKCATCGKLFRPRYEGRKYCSRECMAEGKRKLVECTCKNCGQKFFRSPSTIGEFCSKDCHYQYGHEQRICLGCGQQYDARKSDTNQYCSWDCFKQSRWVTVNCVVCKKEFKKRQSEIAKMSPGAVHCCSIDCRNRYTSLLLGGDGTWNASEDKQSKRKRPGWRKIRNQYMKMVNYVCEGCGGVATDVHHLAPYALSQDNSFDNLMAVCKSCHEIMHEQLNEGVFDDCLEEYLRCERG